MLGTDKGHTITHLHTQRRLQNGNGHTQKPFGRGQRVGNGIWGPKRKVLGLIVHIV